MTKIQVLNNKIKDLLKSKPYSIELLKEIESEIKISDNSGRLAILDLIKLNLNNGEIKSLNSILGILLSTYNFDGKIEQEISIELTNALNALTQNYYELDKVSVEFSYYLIFDIYVHNPGLIEELNTENEDRLLSEIRKISRIKYSAEKRKSSDLLIALQKIIDFAYYFEKIKAEKMLKSHFLTHFDEFIRACAEDELEINFD